jgi:hypothetical protein
METRGCLNGTPESFLCDEQSLTHEAQLPLIAWLSKGAQLAMLLDISAPD